MNDKLKFWIITIVVILIDIICLGSIFYIWTLSKLPEIVVVFSSLLFLFFAGLWTWIGWTGFKSSNPYKKK